MDADTLSPEALLTAALLMQPRSPLTALAWLQAAADQGVAEAALHVGLAHEHGTGVPRNPREAVRWYIVAGSFGVRAAAGRLIALYSRDKVAMDLGLAEAWRRRLSLMAPALPVRETAPVAPETPSAARASRASVRYDPLATPVAEG